LKRDYIVEETAGEKKKRNTFTKKHEVKNQMASGGKKTGGPNQRVSEKKKVEKNPIMYEVMGRTTQECKNYPGFCLVTF